MRSRTIREGSVGLLILLGLGVLGGLILWIRGFDPTRRSYRFVIEFANIAGMDVGAPVWYRGVAVGQTVSVRPDVNVVAVEVEVKPSTLVMPKDVLIQVVQTGLIGETYIDITPRTNLPEIAASVSPLSSECDSDTVICDGDRVLGEAGVSFSELIGSITRFTDLFSNPEIVAEIRTLTRNSANAADGVAELSREVSVLSRSVRQELGDISDATTGTVASVGRAADSIALTANQVDELIASNRTALVSTLSNIDQTTREIQTIVGSLSPVIQEGEFLQNLETLSANAVEASENLRGLTESIGGSENILLLQQTLDSARATFQNAQKITADLDELTGDPAFRENLRNLVDGLSNLVGATEQLQQRTEWANLLDSADIALSNTPEGETAVIDPQALSVSIDPLAPLPETSTPEVPASEPSISDPSAPDPSTSDTSVPEFSQREVNTSQPSVGLER